MKTLNQRSATVNTVLAVLEEAGVKYELNGSVPVSDVLEDKHKADVRAALFTMFRSGEVEMSAEAKEKYAEDSELKKYISGLVNNWIRKAPEFNAGGTYKPKNPGSRAGQGDEQIKEMRKLLKTTVDPEHKKVIEAAIEARQGEIKPKVEIDASKLPESLRNLIK